MIIRQLTAGDAGQLRRLATESVIEGFTFLERMLSDLNAGAIRLDGPGEFFLGVFDRDDLVAVGGITPDPYVGQSGTGRIRHLYVTRAVRRRGVGRALVNALEARACSWYGIRHAAFAIVLVACDRSTGPGAGDEPALLRCFGECADRPAASSKVP